MDTVECEGRTLDTRLMDSVDSITLMTYRNTPSELIDIAVPALQSISGGDGVGKGVWLAVETCSKVEEVSLISYAGKGVERLVGDLLLVEEGVKGKFAGFKGIAIHSYEDFVALGG